MNYGKKIALVLIIIVTSLVFFYFIVSEVWFIAIVKGAVAKVPLVTYEKIGVRGVNAITLYNVRLNADIPMEIRFDEIQITSDKHVFSRKLPYQITINSMEGEIVLGNADNDIEGYRGKRCTIMPFESTIQVNETGVVFTGIDCVVQEAGRIGYYFDLSQNNVSANINVEIEDALITNAPEPEFFKYALNLEHGKREFTLTINGELPLLRVHLKAPLMEMDFAYSTDKR